MPRKPARLLPFRDPPDATRPLGALLNLGPKSSAWLEALGLRSIEQVRALGPIEVCRQLRAHGHPVSVVMAYALEGALAGCHWNAIPGETKQALRLAFAKMKTTAPVGPAARGSRRRPGPA